MRLNRTATVNNPQTRDAMPAGIALNGRTSAAKTEEGWWWGPPVPRRRERETERETWRCRPPVGLRRRADVSALSFSYRSSISVVTRCTPTSRGVRSICQ